MKTKHLGIPLLIALLGIAYSVQLVHADIPLINPAMIVGEIVIFGIIVGLLIYIGLTAIRWLHRRKKAR